MSNLSEFLIWLADRLVHVYKESPNLDIVLRLRKAVDEVEQLEARIAKAIDILESEHDPDLGLWACGRALDALKEPFVGGTTPTYFSTQRGRGE